MPAHLELFSHPAELGREGFEIESVQGPFHPHEEEAQFAILVLIGMGDVGAISIKKPGNAGDETLTVGAMNEKNRGTCH